MQRQYRVVLFLTAFFIVLFCAVAHAGYYPARYFRRISEMY